MSELPVIYWAHCGLGFVINFFFPDFSSIFFFNLRVFLIFD